MSPKTRSLWNSITEGVKKYTYIYDIETSLIILRHFAFVM